MLDSFKNLMKNIRAPTLDFPFVNSDMLLTDSATKGVTDQEGLKSTSFLQTVSSANGDT